MKNTDKTKKKDGGVKMSKAKLLGRVNTPPDRGNKERLRWARQNARREVKQHIPFPSSLLGGADTGFISAAVTAGMKKK